MDRKQLTESLNRIASDMHAAAGGIQELANAYHSIACGLPELPSGCEYLGIADTPDVRMGRLQMEISAGSREEAGAIIFNQFAPTAMRLYPDAPIFRPDGIMRADEEAAAVPIFPVVFFVCRPMIGGDACISKMGFFWQPIREEAPECRVQVNISIPGDPAVLYPSGLADFLPDGGTVINNIPTTSVFWERSQSVTEWQRMISGSEIDEWAELIT